MYSECQFNPNISVLIYFGITQILLSMLQLTQLASVINRVVALTGGINSNSNFFCGNVHDGEVPAKLLGAAYKMLRWAPREWNPLCMLK